MTRLMKIAEVVATTVAISVAGAFGAAAMASGAEAAEITVIGSTAVTEFIEAVSPIFEHDSGHKVKASFLSGSVLPVKVKVGAPADLDRDDAREHR
jgi:ABC-type molybdate transport system substrate-binding protein